MDRGRRHPLDPRSRPCKGWARRSRGLLRGTEASVQHTRGAAGPASHVVGLEPPQARDGRPSAIRVGALRSGRSMSTPTGGITRRHCPCHHSTPTNPFKERRTEHQPRTAGNSGTQHHHRGRNRRYLPVVRLAHRLEYRMLTCIAPPEQGWDKSFDIYSAMEDEGHCSRQISILEEAKSQGRLVTSVPGYVAHVTHRRHIADASVEGKAVRALCDTFFVPRTDPDALPRCPECERRYRELPQR